jgi:hypothetical protein
VLTRISKRAIITVSKHGGAEMIKFNKYNVTNGTEKARVHYMINNRIDGRECVTIYAKGYDDSLSFIDGVINNTDTMTDYFEKDRVYIFKGNPLYESALAAAVRK